MNVGYVSRKTHGFSTLSRCFSMVSWIGSWIFYLDHHRSPSKSHWSPPMKSKQYPYEMSKDHRNSHGFIPLSLPFSMAEKGPTDPVTSEKGFGASFTSPSPSRSASSIISCSSWVAGWNGNVVGSPTWLVVDKLTYPSEKWSESQLGWWHSQLNGKI